MTLPPLYDHLAPLVTDRDVVLCDLWGVVHDGRAPFPGVVEALRTLRAGGRPVVFLSNAPRRAAAVMERLDGLGVPRDAYDGVLSSGESVHVGLRDRAEADFAALGRRCLVIGPPGDRSLLDGVDGLAVVETAAEADFLLNIGPPPRAGVGVADYEPVLAAARQRELPMVCANPDRTVIVAGERVICAGALADRYAETGGRVILRGKPDPAIFHQALAHALGQPGDATRALVIGDSPSTDIRGANAAGMASILVATGLLAEQVGGPDALDPTRLAAALAETDAVPDYVLPRLVW